MTALPLDHLVINTRFDTTLAEQIFTALGFTLTPRGHHAMGSVNHLMVFGDDYLELIGLPETGKTLREEILNSPVGIDGLVFKTDDADGVHAQLQAQGLPVQPLHAFVRPVDIEGQSFEASFRTVRFVPGFFEAGRVYYCQHLTPELIWRRAWRQHANRVKRLSALVIVSDALVDDAERYAKAAGGLAVQAPDGTQRIESERFCIELMDRAHYAALYGDLGCEGADRTSFFGAIKLRVDSAAALHQALDTVGDAVRYRKASGRTYVQVPAFNTLLEFIHGDDAV